MVVRASSGDGEVLRGVRIGECFGAEGCGNVQQVQDRGLFGSRGYVVMGL